MAKLTDIFKEAYNEEVDYAKPFGKGHKAQIDALKNFIADLNADGAFSAVIGATNSAKTILKITDKANNADHVFFIAYGYEPFGESATLQLSPGPDQAPLGGKKGGYDMRRDDDSGQLLEAIGTYIGKQAVVRKVAADTVAYVQNSPRNTP